LLGGIGLFNFFVLLKTLYEHIFRGVIGFLKKSRFYYLERLGSEYSVLVLLEVKPSEDF
jgi:hypothetical protein